MATKYARMRSWPGLRPGPRQRSSRRSPRPPCRLGRDTPSIPQYPSPICIFGALIVPPSARATPSVLWGIASSFLGHCSKYFYSRTAAGWMQILLYTLTYRIVCVVLCILADRYVWQKDGVILEPSSSVQIRQVDEGSTVCIESPTSRHEGFYQCFASNMFGTAVTVKVLLRKASTLLLIKSLLHRNHSTITVIIFAFSFM